MCALYQFQQIDLRILGKQLKAAGLWNTPAKDICWVLIEYINLNDKIKIGDKMEARGATINLGQGKIAEQAEISRATVNKYVPLLEEASIIRRETGGAGSYNTAKYVFCMFDEAIKLRRQDLAEQESSTPEPQKAVNPRIDSFDINPCEKAINHSEKPVNDSEKAVNSKVDRIKSIKEFKGQSSSTSLGASTSIAPTVPNEGEQEEAEHKSRPADPAPEPTPERDPPVPPKAEKPKTSQREKQVRQPDLLIEANFAFRESFRLADHFAGDESEFEDDNQRQQRASRFRDLLIKEFHSTSAAARYPDPDLRLQACVQVVHLWIDIVKSRNTPAQYIGFITTEPGMRALTQARKQVFGSADQYREIELDPTVQALWRAKYGDNWREKREQEIAARAA